MLPTSKQKAYIQVSSGCNSWSEHGNEIEFDQKRLRYFWIVIYRRWCHYFHKPTDEHIGFRKKSSSSCIIKGSLWDSTQDWKNDRIFVLKKYFPGHARRAFFNHRRESIFQPQFANPRAYNSSFQEEMLLLWWIPCQSAQTNHPFPPFGWFVRADF